MPQVTWRASEDVISRVRVAAAAQHRSVNEFMTLVLSAATDPELADDESQRIRERLERAGLLERTEPRKQHRRRPSKRRLDEARRAAGKGTPLSSIVSGDRR